MSSSRSPRFRCSERCTWMSTNPGATTMRRASITRSGGRGGFTSRAGPTCAMRAPSTRTEPSVKIRRPASTVMTVPCSTRIIGAGRGSGARGDDAMPLAAEAVDALLHHVAGLEIARGLGAVADASRRAGGDAVADLERHEPAQVRDEGAHREHHVLGVAVLAPLAVHGGPHRQALRVGDLVGGDQPGPDRREGDAALALGGAA